MSAVNSNTFVLTGTGQASTTYVIPHGVRGVPASFVVSASDAGSGSCAPIFVTALDATNASIQFHAGVPSGGPASVAWFASQGA